MSLPALQNDSNVPSSKLANHGNAYWYNHVLVHVSGFSDGTGDGQWSFDSTGGHRIEYNSTLDKWFDLADGQPSKISDTATVNNTAVSGSSTGANPAEVFLWNNNGDQFIGKFANPFYSSGGTSTEGSSAPSGSFYINAQGQIVFVISASSPSSDGNVVYKIYRRPLNSALEQAYVVPHTSGTITDWTIGLNYSLYDRWELRVESSTALVQSAVLAVYTTYNKKVFRNFW